MAKVTPHLNAESDIKNWEVDINNPEKVLTVETESLEPTDIQTMVEKLGFKAEFNKS